MDLTTLQQQVRYLTNSDSDSYSNTDINQNLTRWTHLLTTEILDSQDEWDFQGEIATANLVADQNEYAFPSDILKIKRVEVTYDGTNWYPVIIFDITEKANALTGNETDDFDKTKPCAEIYDTSLFLYPTPDAAITNGLKIWYSEEVVGKNAAGTDITSFSTSTDTPNIREAFQRGLIYGAAKDWAGKYELWDKVKVFDGEVEKTIIRMKQFYGSRIQDRRVILKTVADLENYE